MSVPPATEPRTLAPPERRVAEITANEPVGAYALLTARDAGGPSDPVAGQFYMLSGEERWGGEDGRPYLPRAFSFARARPAAGGGTELDFLLEEVGPGTARLGELRPGEGLGLVGPLGCGFRPGPGRPLLVGGGIGVAPLLCLADALSPQSPDSSPQSPSPQSPGPARLSQCRSCRSRRAVRGRRSPHDRRWLGWTSGAGDATFCGTSWTATPPRRSTAAAPRRCWQQSTPYARTLASRASLRSNRAWRVVSEHVWAAWSAPRRATYDSASTVLCSTAISWGLGTGDWGLEEPLRRIPARPDPERLRHVRLHRRAASVW